MGQVADNLELAKPQSGERGFILNVRHDVKRLHRAGCEAVGAMVATAYPKMFFETGDEARQWSDAQYGPSGWTKCGLCRSNWEPSYVLTSAPSSSAVISSAIFSLSSGSP